MKRYTSIAFTTGVLLLSLTACADKGGHSSKVDPIVIEPVMNCDSTVTVDSTIPATAYLSKIGNGYQGLTPSDQACFDMLSWKLFTALNWPADNNGNPAQVANIGDDTSNFRVWEYYDGVADVFDPNTQKTHAKNKHDEKFPGNTKTIDKLSKTHGSPGSPLTSFIQASGQPMVDKNLNYLVYEVRINPTEVNYITSNSLQTISGQKSFVNDGKTVDFPAGSETANTTGAMEIKSAWKLLTTDEIASGQFYTRTATINVDKAHTVSGNELTLNNVTIGLVGMHIFYQIPRFDGIWATFEQINNAPDINDLSNNPIVTDKSLYNDQCPSTVCGQNMLNQATSTSGNYLWSSTQPYAQTAAFQDGKNSYGTQTVRIVPIPDYTQRVNTMWQSSLAKTVWANYQLIGTQWLSKTDGYPSIPFPVPHALSNMTMETYDQASSSCISCHQFATIVDDQSADFSFLLSHAK